MTWLRDPAFVALLNGTLNGALGGAFGYWLGRLDGRRQNPPTCQENTESPFGPGDHMHECTRERGHRSAVHRCHCGRIEWRTAEDPHTPRPVREGEAS